MNWIKALRPLAGIASVMFVVAGFRFAKQPVDWIVVTAVFLVYSFAILNNDYHDREVDVGKGRLLAFEQPKRLYRLSGAFYLASGLIIGYIVTYDQGFGLLLSGMLLVALFYPNIQLNPYAKNLAVSLTIGSTFLFPVFRGADPLQWAWFFALTLAVAFREYIKDAEDLEVDRGYKKTFAMMVRSNWTKPELAKFRYLVNVYLLCIVVTSLVFY